MIPVATIFSLCLLPIATAHRLGAKMNEYTLNCIDTVSNQSGMYSFSNENVLDEYCKTTFVVVKDQLLSLRLSDNDCEEVTSLEPQSICNRANHTKHYAEGTYTFDLVPSESFILFVEFSPILEVGCNDTAKNAYRFTKGVVRLVNTKGWDYCEVRLPAAVRVQMLDYSLSNATRVCTSPDVFTLSTDGKNFVDSSPSILGKNFRWNTKMLETRCKESYLVLRNATLEDSVYFRIFELPEDRKHNCTIYKPDLNILPHQLCYIKSYENKDNKEQERKRQRSLMRMFRFAKRNTWSKLFQLK